MLHFDTQFNWTDRGQTHTDSLTRLKKNENRQNNDRETDEHPTKQATTVEMDGRPKHNTFSIATTSLESETVASYCTS